MEEVERRKVEVEKDEKKLERHASKMDEVVAARDAKGEEFTGYESRMIELREQLAQAKGELERMVLQYIVLESVTLVMVTVDMMCSSK